MGQALYRGYRPKSFDEVIGQDHITKTLQKAIASGRISHAYLFTGPRGVGKTSVARVLAHAVNDLPYTDESIHLDIIEIDAASNRRIDEIRELRDKVHISPTSAKYKVYIIDEVHMLTREAFNALLKTLEEPPAHAIFILATTEAHKLPETIISRTQRFEFKPISRSYAVEHLAEIAKKEKINVDKPALMLLAEHGEGSFRDSISLLDQLGSSGEKITEQDVRDLLGLPPADLVQSLQESLSNGDTAAALNRLDELRGQGANPALIARLLAADLRTKLISGPAQSWAADLLRRLIEVPASYHPDDALEIAVLEACARGGSQPIPINKNVPAAIPIESDSAPVESQEPEESPAEEKTVTAAPEKNKPPKKTPTTDAPLDDQAWEEIVSRVKDQAAALYTALRLATPQFDEGKLTLAFQFPLHQKKVAQAQHKDLIGQIVAEVTGQQLSIDTVVDKSKSAKPRITIEKKPIVKPANETLGTISNIFGTAEVVESGESR